MLGFEDTDLAVSLLLQCIYKSCGGFHPRRVIVQAERYLLQRGILLQHPQHGVFGHSAESNIAVISPPAWIDRDKGQQINRSFKNIKPVTGSAMMKTVARIATGYIPFEALAKCVQSTLMCVTRNAVFVFPDEHGVVMLSDRKSVV